MSIIQGTAKATAGDDSFYSFPLSGSLRFDGSSYLTNPNFSNSSTSTWTYSSWIKRSDLSSHNILFGRENTATEDEALRFNSNNSINFYIYNSGAYQGQIETTTKFRDVSSWYHIVAVWATAMKLYVNGVEVGSDSASGVSTINTNVTHRIGRVSTNYFKGYMAEINFIDGQALNPYYFGEFKSGSVWIPKQFNGTASDTTYNVSGASNAYGTNGFRLSFSDATSLTTLGYDSSGNNNHWTLV